MPLFCCNCGKKATRTRIIDEITSTCNECNSSASNGMNDYVEEFVSNINVATTPNDDELLSNISFGSLKEWLTSTYVQHIKEVDKRLTNEIVVIKKDLATTKSGLESANTEIRKLKKDFNDFKTSSSQSVNELTQRASALEEDTEKRKTVAENNLRYLINFDRNERRRNVIIIGVPELNSDLKIGEETLKSDQEKCDAILRFIGTPADIIEKAKEMFRLGKPVDGTVRPIKVKFPTSNGPTAVLNVSKNLNDLPNYTIYVKPDKTKAEQAEFQRIGKRKSALLAEYPKVDENTERVVLQKGVLQVDGVEVDRYKPVQSIF